MSCQAWAAYEVRGRRFLRCIVAPLGGGGILVPVCVVAFVLLLVGGWVTVGAASFLALLEWRAYSLGLRADARGLFVRNFVLRHRIPWPDVRGIWSPDRSGVFELIPTVRIARRSRRGIVCISAYVTLGLGREERRKIALDLVELTRVNGYEVIGGSETEVTATLQAMNESDEVPGETGGERRFLFV